MRKLLSVVALALAGCAATMPTGTIYMRESRPYHEFEADARQCAYESKLAVRRGNTVGSGSFLIATDIGNQREELQWSCMRARGYEVQPGPGLRGEAYQPERT